MGPDPIQTLVEENERLQIGRKVLVTWTDDHGTHHGRGHIVALRPRRVSVRIEQQLDHGRPCRPGLILDLPRISDFEHWTLDNCVKLERPGQAAA